MAQICMHPNCGAPIPQNASPGSWRIIHTLSGDDISANVVFANDENGDLWRLIETKDGLARRRAGAPVVEKLHLGPGGLRLEPAPHLKLKGDDDYA